MPQSKELTAFYNRYKKWLEDGAPEGEPFTRRFGLCHNLYLLNTSILSEIEMLRQFKDAGLDIAVPFNSVKSGSKTTYARETATDSIHLNPLRIEWVRNHAN